MTAAADLATHMAVRVVASAPAPGQIIGPVDLVYGTNCREGPERPATSKPGRTTPGAVPHECIFIVPTGGRPNQSFVGGDPALTPRTTLPELWPGIDDPTFDVVVRGLPKDFDRTHALALVARQAIDRSIPSGYFDCLAPQPPAYVREDDQNRHVFVFPAELRTCQ